MSELFDAHGKPITVGCAVRRLQGAFGNQEIAHVTEIRGHSIIVDVLMKISVDEIGGRAGMRKVSVTCPPVYLGSLVEVVA